MALADLRIKPASLDDLEDILRLAGVNSLEALTPAQATARGFLVSGFSEKEYRAFLAYESHFYTASSSGTVVGFVLAYQSSFIQPDEWINWRIRQLFPDDFVLIKQVAVDPSRMGEGIGAALYEYLLGITAPLPAFAAIVVDPPNPRSVRFHEGFGFVRVAEGTPPDGLRRGVWAIRTDTDSDAEPIELQ